MKTKIAVTKWFYVDEKQPECSGKYLVSDGCEIALKSYSAKHKAWGVTDSMPEKDVEWCKIHPIEWAKFPEFAENITPDTNLIALLISLQNDLERVMSELSNIYKSLGIYINKK